MPNTNELYSKVATDGAKMIWQTLGNVLPHVGTLYTADQLGNMADWVLGKRQPDTEQKSFTSRLNPLSYLRSANPVSMGSFMLTPFKGGKKFVSWSALEAIAGQYKDEIGKHWQKLAPAGEKFLKPFVEAAVRPFLNYLQDQGIMQIPPAVVETACECPELNAQTFDAIKEMAIIPEETGLWSTTVTAAKNFLITPFSEWFGSAAVDNTPTPIQQVFQQVVQPEVLKPIKEHVTKKTPQGLLEIAEHHAEPTARFIVETCTSAYQGMTKAVQKPYDVGHAAQESVHLLAEALGIHPGWIVATGVCVAGLASYGVYSGLHGAWGSKATATGGNATVNGGNPTATGGNVNLTFQFPPTPTQTAPSVATQPTDHLTSPTPKNRALISQ